MAENRSEHGQDLGQNPGNGLWGLLAEYDTPDKLITACNEVREAGFTRWDAHAPYPVHGSERAMGLRISRVPLFVLVLGLAGAAFGMGLQSWVAIDAYPLVISGKPLFSWPAFVPIMFECGVLGGAVGAIFGFLILSRLPRPHHELFVSERFERSTDDRFFVSVEAADPKFDPEATETLLRRAGATGVEEIPVESEPEIRSLRDLTAET
jgi:hypothetical protein